MLRTVHYAAPPPSYFWIWSSDHAAAEWIFEGTLALWQELHPLLVFLDEEKGLPPLGAVLLVLAACRDDWSTRSENLGLWLESIVRDEFLTRLEGDLVTGLMAALLTVHRLPKMLRGSLQAKCLLLSVIFENVPRLAREASSEVMDELRLGGPGMVAGKLPDLDNKARFLRDAKAVLTGLAEHDERSLESRIHTGLDHPDLLGAKLPEEIRPRDEGRPLLEVLDSLGGERGAAAAIARQAIAMINLPGRVGSPHDLPVGGISDITNRGTIDRLLPGELAWDDLVLAARLVHNEALYFRREVPPSDIRVRHVVLLDRSLRLWGQARVFSLGVALGLAHHPSFQKDTGGIEVFGAGITEDEPLDLQTPEGVHMALQALVPLFDPTGFLGRWRERLDTQEITTADDFAFITAAEHLESPDCRMLLGEIAHRLATRGGIFRVITLARGGALEIQLWSGSGNRTVFRGMLEEQAIVPQQPEKAAIPLRKPWSMLTSASPFLFPITPSHRAFIEDPETGGGLGISTDKRLARWPKAGWGGEEISPLVPGRDQWLAQDENGDPIIVVSPVTPGERVGVYRLAGNALEQVPIAKPSHSYPRFATVAGGAVLLCYTNLVEAFSLATGHRLAELRGRSVPPKPLLSFDGQRISILGSGAAENPVSTNWSHGDRSSWPAMFSPDAISLHDGVLRLHCGSECHNFDPGKLHFSVHPVFMSSGLIIPFATVGGSSDQPMKRLARLSSKVTALHDSRGVLEIYDANGAGDAWHVLLASPATSVWHSRWGLLSFEARLRQPSQGNPTPETLDTLTQFLKSAAKPPILA